MDMPESWVWIWLVAGLVFAVGEMSSPGSFFLLPFAVGAFVAGATSLLGTPLVVEWAIFVVVSAVMLFALRPLARRLDRSGEDHGVGSRRLVGQTAVVTQEIPAGGELGMARVHRENWRAESLDGSSIPEGATVRVTAVEGTRVIVAQADVGTPPAAPPDTPPTTTP